MSDCHSQCVTLESPDCCYDQATWNNKAIKAQQQGEQVNFSELYLPQNATYWETTPVSEMLIYQALNSQSVNKFNKALLFAAGPQGDKNIARHCATKFVC